MVSLVYEFLEDYKRNRHPYIATSKNEKQRIMTEEELVNMLANIELMYRHNPDEMVNTLVGHTIEEYESIRKKYNIPGYTAAVQVGNISVGIFGGKTNSFKDAIDMPEDALFDIASMTKLYTQIVVYNLMAEGLFKLTDKIIDIDKRFTELGDTTVGDILSFAVAFKTPGRIDDAPNDDEALSRLFGTTIAKDEKMGLLKGYYDYNDIGMMIIKEVVEEKTKMTFEQLIDQYVLAPLKLKNTHLIVPKDKYPLITGTPNLETAHVNDMKANMMKNGYSGHAGIFASYSDIMKVMRAALSGIILPDTHDLITPSSLQKIGRIKDKDTGIERINLVDRDFNARMGNVFLGHKGGVDTGWVPNMSPGDSIGASGSTRVTGIASTDSAFTTLFNPASVSIEEARERINEENERRKQRGQSPFDVDRKANTFDRIIGNKPVKFNFIEADRIMPLVNLENAVNEMGKLTIQLRFLDFMMKKDDKNYEIDYKRRVA